MEGIGIPLLIIIFLIVSIWDGWDYGKDNERR